MLSGSTYLADLHPQLVAGSLLLETESKITRTILCPQDHCSLQNNKISPTEAAHTILYSPSPCTNWSNRSHLPLSSAPASHLLYLVCSVWKDFRLDDDGAIVLWPHSDGDNLSLSYFNVVLGNKASANVFPNIVVTETKHFYSPLDLCLGHFPISLNYVTLEKKINKHQR